MGLNYVPGTVTPTDLGEQRSPADDPPAAPSPPHGAAERPGDLLEHLLVQIDPLDQPTNIAPAPTRTAPLIGRQELLTDIRGRLLAGPVRLALEGPPGAGKSRLALEIAADELVRRHFGDMILSIGLGQHPEIEAHLRAWAAALGLEHDPRLSAAEQAARLTAHIDQRGVPCLLILDDVWKAEHCAFLLESQAISVLMTGRQQEASDLGELLEDNQLIAVPPLDEPAAIEVLRQQARLPTPDEDELALLATLVGGSPLALVLTGAYLREHYQDEDDWLPRLLDDLHQAAQRTKLSTEQIEQARHNLHSGVLARLRQKPIAAPINPRIVVELCVSALPPGARGAFGRLVALPPDPLSFGLAAAQAAADVDEETLQTLVRYALIEHTSSGRFRMHRVMADWISQRYHAEVEEARKRFSAWLLGLARGGSDDLEEWRQHPDDWPSLLQLWHKSADSPEQVRAALQGLLPILIDSGSWSAAQTGLESILDTHQRDRTLAPLARYHMGLLHYRRADFGQAQEYTTATLEGFEQAEQTRSQIMTLNLLGHIQKAAGDYPAARSSYETALGLTQESDGRQRAACLTNIALLLQAEGDYAAARPLYNQALTICEQTLDPTHPDIAASLANLAGLLHDLGHYAAARPLCERALAIHEQALGPNHPHTAASLTSLARLFQAQGDFAAARPLYERALAIHEQALGPHHPDTATSLNNLALMHKAQGNLAAARPLYERALAIRTQALGPHHPDTATSLNNLASLLYELGDLESARPLCTRALAIRGQVLGLENPHTITSLTSLALLERDAGRFEDAAQLLRRAYALRTTALGAEHASTIRLKQLLEEVERHVGKPGESKA